ncbi:MAG: glycosyl hydrolase [Sediminibacterium sp.]|nr:glycosyl hydrolase [Sediminibacterium sp.]
MLSICWGNLFAKNTTALVKIQATAHSVQIPVLVGITHNPILQVRITVPEGSTQQTITALETSIDPTSLQDIQQVDVFITGAEPFSPQHLLATVQSPVSNQVFIVNEKLNPGVYNCWFSVQLKPDANIDHFIELKCRQLTLNNKNIIPVEQENTSYKKRIGVAVRKVGDDKVHTFRIPGIISTQKGTLLAVYDIRYDKSGDLPGNIDVGLSRSTNGGKTWEPMKIIMDMGPPHANNGVGDPAILFDPKTNTIWVAALWSKGNRSIAGSLPGLSPDSTGQLVLVSSADDGITWSAPKSITPQVKNPAWHLFFQGPGSGITMKNGQLVFAAQYWDETKMPHATIIYSDDHGQTWKGQIAGPKSNTTESQVVETNPGTLLLNMRDNRGNFRSIATTRDFGKTWIEHPGSYNALPDPVCMGSLVKSSVWVKDVKKEVLFFSNPNTSSGRFNLTIKASTNLGTSWPKEQQVLIDERLGFGYSSITPIDASSIGILYEGIRELYFVKVKVSDFFNR